MKKLLQVLVLIPLVLSACAAPDASIVGTWNLTAHGAESALTPAVSDSGASLVFNDDGTVTGSSGCNGFGGEYVMQDGQITFSQIVSTLMACEDPIMSQESALFNVLSGTANYVIEGDTLTLSSDGTVVVLSAATGP